MVGGAADSDTGGDVAHHQGPWGRGRAGIKSRWDSAFVQFNDPRLFILVKHCVQDFRTYHGLCPVVRDGLRLPKVWHHAFRRLRFDDCSKLRVGQLFCVQRELIGAKDVVPVKDYPGPAPSP